MRKSKAETAATRRRIVEVAILAFKTNGIQATAVAEIMAAAGLTHGGFYRHFSSKEHLLAEACAVSMDVLVQATAVAAAAGDDVIFFKHLQSLLSGTRQEDLLEGCFWVAAGSELARADEQTRQAASKGFQEMIDIIAMRSRTKSYATAKEDAIFMLFSMVGAVTMARITVDSEHSGQIMKVARKRLADWR